MTDLNKFKQVIESELNSFLDSEIAYVNDPFIKSCYGLIKDYAAGGKKLRPLATILAYKASKKDDDKIMLPAIAIELHHIYSLILDDIMDEDELRRNNLTVYKKLKELFAENYKDRKYEGSLFNSNSSRFAASFALMLGNITNILSKKAIFSSDFADVLKYKALIIMEKTDQLLYHGQMMDIYTEFSESNEEKYLEMVKLKTATMFGLAFEFGSLFGGTDHNMFKEFGLNTAFGFQIQDDINDLAERSSEIGSDLKKGKKTLLVIKAFEKADEDQLLKIKAIIGNPNSTNQDIETIKKMFEELGIIDYCKNLASKSAEKSKEILDKLNISKESKVILKKFADHISRSS